MTARSSFKILLDPAKVQGGGNREAILISQVGQNGWIAAQRHRGFFERSGIDLKIAVFREPNNIAHFIAHIAAARPDRDLGGDRNDLPRDLAVAGVKA